MTRRRFKYDRATDRMVEIALGNAGDESPMVCGDIPAFRSPLDGTIVEGRRQYEEHMKKHHVVPFEAGDEKRRPPGESAHDKQARREMIWELVDRVQQGHKARD